MAGLSASSSSPFTFWEGIYRIAGFICEVLICANYARRCGLAEFNLEFNIGLAYKDLHFADFIIADITAGLKIVCSQKLCLAHFTRYTVYS